jgi:hypothetical protein
MAGRMEPMKKTTRKRMVSKRMAKARFMSFLSGGLAAAR